MTLDEKIMELERLCPGATFKVEGEGDEALIKIDEFGRGFTVRKEWADLEGDWPECWFDYEIAHRPEPQDVSAEVAMRAANHEYLCRCGLCKEWWKLAGPDPATKRCGPWTMEELGLDPADWEVDDED
jgi:hypothetical protein